MPFYEYICEACGKDFVLLQSMGAKAEDTACPYCNEKKVQKNTLEVFVAEGKQRELRPRRFLRAAAEASRRSAVRGSHMFCLRVA